MEIGRFPSARAVSQSDDPGRAYEEERRLGYVAWTRARRSLTLRDAPEPERALEEERRLAYVAWTRARRSLTLLYDPTVPSPFLAEAFTPTELGTDATMDA